jgi:murein DD-endopeptidase MepM/ murein hydrolase activator NlpD
LLTYPRFAKACYTLFAVAVLAALLKLSVSGAEPALLEMLPAVPTASAVEPTQTSPERPEDPRLGEFSDDRESFASTLSPSDVRADETHTPSGADSSDSSSDESSYDASVFRRPSLDLGSSTEPVCGDLGDVAGSSRVVFPLPEEYFDSYDDTWGAARPQGGHEGSDLMSPAGTPEFAVTDGRLVAVAGSNEDGWNTLGGYTVMLEAAYDVGPIKKGDLFYYAHLDRETSLPVGTQVRAGQKIGTVGDTGEGPEVTRGKFPPHLHLGWYDANFSEERSEAESGAMNPYPLLLWLEENGGSVSGGTDTSYCQAPQSPNPAPSTGEPDWPTSPVPGQRPDLDTGDASPSPEARDHGHRHDRPEHDGEGSQGKEQEARDRGKDEEKNRGEGKEQDPEDGSEGDESGGPEKADERAEKLALRKKIEERMDALLRDLPGFARTTPENQDGREQGGKKKGDGRKNGEQNGKERGEGQRKVERPVEESPEARRGAPANDPPGAPAPSAPAPDRETQPTPEKKSKGTEAKKEPEDTAPSDPDPESPATDPEPLPNPSTSGPAPDGATPENGTVGEVEPVATENEAAPATEPDKQE